MTQPLIELQEVVKRFGTQTVLDGVNLRIYRGEVTTIIGKSGEGKSVLLKHIVGLLRPDAGRILFDGTPVEGKGVRERDRHLGRISYMFQNNALFDSLTVFENVAMPLRHTTRLPRAEIRERAMARIEQTELGTVAQRYPAELSGGMQKRVALARALVTDPEVILFDEPTTGQDPIRKNAILSMISGYQRTLGFTAVLISHDIPDVFFISNRIGVLYEGKIVFQGSPESLETFEHPFQEELLESLEGLQQGLTGLYSRRQFKLRYQTDLDQRNADATYAVIVFTLRDLDAISLRVGHTRAQELIRDFGRYIQRRFAPVGGFSTRYGIDQFATLLPNSDSEEAAKLLEGVASDLRDDGLGGILDRFRSTSEGEEECFDIAVQAGIAEGRSHVEIDSIVGVAEFKQTDIARWRCGPGK